MDRVVFWDFDETLAFRPGRWRGCLSETLDEHQPDHGITSEQLRPFLQDGFPWHRPETSHPELCEPEAWWTNTEDLLARAYEGVGIDGERANELARLARQRYVDGSVGWRLFDDTMPTLDRLHSEGWRHAILSNHVPELSPLVEALGLGDRIDAVFSSAVTGYEKPHRAAFEIALKHCGYPSTVWMVGDNPVADVAGAESAGIPAILVRAKPEGATRHAADLRAVIPILSADA